MLDRLGIVAYDKGMSKPKRPKDPNQRAKLIVDIATGETSDPVSTKNPAAVALGKLGGSKGGKARANKLTPERRSEISRDAAKARWKKDD